MATITPFAAELVGTAILVMLGDSVVANTLLNRTKGHGAGWMAITTGWALATFVAVYSVAAASGAHLNPAVTVGLHWAGLFPADRVASYVLAQMLGGLLGATLMWLLHLPHWSRTTDPDIKLACFCNAPAVRAPLSNLVTEMVATAMLVFGILALKEAQVNMDGSSVVKVSLGALGVVPMALLVFAIGLCLGGPTGYAINPARDLSPRIAHALLPIPGKGASDWGYAWVPVLGPMLGGVAGAGLFRALGFQS